MMENYLEYSAEVQEAKKANKPIVALESTIISHGMPYPQNVETAKEVEEIIRKNGAVPATIAIINGKIKIGLSDEDLEFLGTSKDIEKASRRDLPYLIANKKNGATTVAEYVISWHVCPFDYLLITYSIVIEMEGGGNLCVVIGITIITDIITTIDE